MIAIHHMAGILTAKQCGTIFQNANRQASANYGIGKDADVGLYVDEANTSWCNTNWDSNCKSVTIEVSNCEVGGNWKVSDKVLNKLIELVADIAKRNKLGKLVKGKNVVWHSMYIATTCPGKYLLSKMDYIIEQANKINEQVSTSSTTETTTSLKHKVGEIVKYNKIYSSSTSTEALQPAYTSGKITKIYKNKRNPYLIGNETGFVNDDCIISSSTSKVSYKVGNNYTTQVILKVRTGAGTNYSQKTYNQLTANGKQNAYGSGVNVGCLKKGTVVTCQEIKNVGNDIWIRIPSGWIAGYYSGQVYVK